MKKVKQTKPVEMLFLNEIVMRMPGYVFWKNRDYVYLGCNENLVKASGLNSPADFIGKTDYDLPWSSNAKAFQEDDEKVMLSGQAKINIEEPLVHANGFVSTVLTSKVPLKDEEGTVIGIIAISSDITERKLMEQELKKSKEKAEIANRAKSEFIANMSHDIRTPLSGVIGMSKMLEESTDNPQDKQIAQWVKESGEQLLGLLNGILEIISADNVQDKDLVSESFDLYQCIQELVQLELPTIKLKNLALSVEIDEAIPRYVISDRPKLHRILLNLLGNAIKFTPEGNIELAVKLLEQLDDMVRLRFSIADTGIGIPESLQSKVFDRFYRVNPSYHGVYKGFGIGLHIAQSYVELLGGEIQLNSAVEKGTVFYFDLLLKAGFPVQKEDALERCQRIESQPAGVVCHVSAANTAQQGPTVLLVEDNSIAMHMIEMIANKASCRTFTAENAEKALQLFQSNHFDLVLTDIGLPGMSGIDLARSIRNIERESELNFTPIVGLTAHTGKTEVEECLQSGMDKVIIKPATLSVFKALIEEFMPSNQPQPITKPAVSETNSPFTEDELFKLDQFPILDVERGLSILGDKTVLKDLLSMMFYDGIDKDKQAIENAYINKDWDLIEALAHKIKGGAAYCGTVKVHEACINFEQYKKAGYTNALDNLTAQLISVLEETKIYLQQWLSHNK